MTDQPTPRTEAFTAAEWRDALIHRWGVPPRALDAIEAQARTEALDVDAVRMTALLREASVDYSIHAPEGADRTEYIGAYMSDYINAYLAAKADR